MAVTGSRIMWHAEARQAVVIGVQTAVTLGTVGFVSLYGLFITAALTGTCVITGFSGSAGTAISITLPAATPAGFKEMGGMVNDQGPLTITCSNALDANLVTAIFVPV